MAKKTRENLSLTILKADASDADIEAFLAGLQEEADVADAAHRQEHGQVEPKQADMLTKPSQTKPGASNSQAS